MTYDEMKEIVSNYKASFTRCNIRPYTLYNLDHNYVIEMTKTVKTGKRISSIETELLNIQSYANCISWACALDTRIEKSYSTAGYLPYKLTSVSPYENKRVIITFDYIPIQ